MLLNAFDIPLEQLHQEPPVAPVRSQSVTRSMDTEAALAETAAAQLKYEFFLDLWQRINTAVYSACQLPTHWQHSTNYSLMAPT